MKKTRCFSVLPGRLRLLRIGLGSAAFLSGALLLADVLVNAGGGSSNADKTGNGGGILDYGQVTFSGPPPMKITRCAASPRAERFTQVP